MHPDNPHKERYDIPALVSIHNELKQYISNKSNGELTINFGSSKAVVELNRALLKKHYTINHWPLPNGYLCPGVPGRVNYLLYLKDLLGNEGSKKILDIGCGANLIYPIVGIRLFDWHFKASDIDTTAIKNAKEIKAVNKLKKLTIVQQKNPQLIFKGVVDSTDKFDACICNPPFYASLSEAYNANLRKNKNLKQRNTERNFEGQFNELVFKGGEIKFLQMMIDQSQHYAQQFNWFTSLVSQEKIVSKLTRQIQKLKGKAQVIDMDQGNKKSRILAWQFKN